MGPEALCVDESEAARVLLREQPLQLCCPYTLAQYPTSRSAICAHSTAHRVAPYATSVPHIA
eukprot:626875-Rhodomonas_salina.2